MLLLAAISVTGQLIQSAALGALWPVRVAVRQYKSMKSLRPVVLFAIVFSGFNLTGCAVVDWMTYKLPIQQGNFIEQKDVDKLRPGMSRDQVLFVLGNPIARSSFDDTRWDYLYTLRLGGDVTSEKKLTAFFKQDTLERIEGDFKTPDAFTRESADAQP